VTTDNGHLILDVRGFDLVDPVATETAINQIAGVVSSGIFARRPADRVLVATESGIDRR
jgi:ribose 5-phosphate isomerase A